jgi:class 3 adenylate cyclase
LAVFGHPTAHENDVRRAVLAGLEITRGVARLSDQAKRRFGIEITVRVGCTAGWCIWTPPRIRCTGWRST